MQTNVTANMRQEKVNQHRIKSFPHSFPSVSTEYTRLFLHTLHTRLNNKIHFRLETLQLQLAFSIVRTHK